MGDTISEQETVREAPRTLGARLLRLGPGMIIAGSIVGSGELIATTKVGAEAGIWLLWLIIVGCVIKVFTQVEIGRHTILHGETPLKALDQIPGPRYRINWLVALVAVMTCLIVTQQGGIVGGVGQALSMTWPLTDAGAASETARDSLIAAKIELTEMKSPGIATERIAGLAGQIATLEDRVAAMPVSHDATLWAVLLAALTSVLLYVGRYRFIQAFATILVGLFTLVTVTSLVLMQQTDWALSLSDVADGLSFRIPPSSEGVDPVTTALAAFGIIGLGAAELLMYPYWCLEKGYARWTGVRTSSANWTHRARGWIGVLQLDAWLSMVVYTLATVSFYMLGASVLGKTGLNPSGSEMVRTLSSMYVPVFGDWARPVFLLGAVAVLYSTFFVAAASMSRLVADLFGLAGLISSDEEARLRWTRRIGVAWPLVAIVLLLTFQAPVAMVLASGTMQAFMLPILGGAALYFRFRRGIPGLLPGRIWDGLLWLSFAGLLIAGCWTVINLFWV